MTRHNIKTKDKTQDIKHLALYDTPQYQPLFSRYDYKNDVKYFDKDFKPIKIFNVDSVYKITHGVIDLYTGYSIVVKPVRDEDGKFTHRDAIYLNDTETHETISSYDGMEPSDTLLASIIRFFSVAPSRTMIASVHNRGGALEIYKINGDTIARTFIKNYFPVDYIYPEGQDFPEINQESQYGFRDVTSTSDYIYASYCDSKEEQPLVTTIGVWDWDGNPIKKIITDKNIWKLKASPDGKRLYCVSNVAGAGEQLCYIEL